MGIAKSNDTHFAIVEHVDLKAATFHKINICICHIGQVDKLISANGNCLFCQVDDRFHVGVLIEFLYRNGPILWYEPYFDLLSGKKEIVFTPNALPFKIDCAARSSPIYVLVRT